MARFGFLFLKTELACVSYNWILLSDFHVMCLNFFNIFCLEKFSLVNLFWFSFFYFLIP
jgi:hypothetical protein